jgi:hypothetical protein
MKYEKFTNNLIAYLFMAAMILFTASCSTEPNRQIEQHTYPEQFTISKSDLKDKIRGGWAGQVIGCTYGGPTEFHFQGTMIQDYQPIEWNDGQMEWYYLHAPGLYDDIYMDLTFVEVIEREGVDAPAASHAHAFATAEYALWHANQAARYNILNGVGPPASGYWEQNPHADDIDFQIEADFAGLMNPGMVNASSSICDRVGHIMNYGDGWYGGVYVAAMYALAFYSDDVEFIVKEALRSIPEESEFFKCIDDVIGWYYLYPDDWKRTWFEAERKWSSDVGCPDGVFDSFNIDAKINAAYIVIGLLYGDGDFGRTVDISTRCGQDSDCNPASAGGILGTMIGYSAIPEYWKQGLDRVEDMDFKYTTISLNDAYDMSYRHSLEMIERNGGETEAEEVTIMLQQPEPVAYEKGFEGHFPVLSMGLDGDYNRLEPGGNLESTFDFNGIGFVVKGGARRTEDQAEEMNLMVEVTVDGVLLEEAVLPTSYQARRHEVTWKYNLEKGPHEVKVRWMNPTEGYRIDLNRVIIYDSEPYRNARAPLK